MNILIITHLYPPNRVGGMEKIIEGQVNALLRQGHIITVLTGRTNDYNLICEDSDNLKIIQTKCSSIIFENPFITEHIYLNLSLVEAFIDSDLDIEYDLIHANDWFVGEAAIILKKMLDIPLVSTFHYSKYHESLGRENTNKETIIGLQKKLLDLSNLITVYSDRMINDIKVYYEGSKKVRKFDLGCDDMKIHDTIKKDSILLIGRLAKEKNFQLVFNACRVLKERGFDISIDVVGDGREYNNLLNYARNNELDVKFHGFINDSQVINQYFMENKIMILPSTYESFGLVVLESLMCNTPVIISTEAGATEISLDLAKYCFNPYSVDSLVEKMIYSLQDYDSTREDFKAIVGNVKEKYTWDNSAKQLTRFYSEVVDA